MPYKKYPPVDEATMDRKRFEGHHSVCQTLRDIYHLTDDPEIKLKCRLAVAMTKAMHERLKWYKAKNLAEAEIREKKDAST